MIYKRTVVALVVAVLMADGVYAQRRGMGGYYGIRRPEPNSFTGSFTFCRIAFRAAYSGYGGGWGVDYPRADQNLPIRMSELTKAAVNFDESGSPHYLMIQATEPELLRCPSSPSRIMGVRSSVRKKQRHCASRRFPTSGFIRAPA